MSAVRWVTTSHRGFYVHAFAFQLAQQQENCIVPGPKWGYLLGVGRSDVPTADMQYGTDTIAQDDFFTRDAAEQAALDCGKLIADVMVDCG